MSQEREPDQVHVEHVAPISPQHKAMAEAGREMLISSIRNGRDFCKFMVGITSGSLPVYLGLLKLVVRSPDALSVWERAAIALPVGPFLFAIWFFVVGCLPRERQFAVDVIEQIQEARAETMKELRIYTIRAVRCFMVGTVLAAVVITSAVLLGW